MKQFAHFLMHRVLIPFYIFVWERIFGWHIEGPAPQTSRFILVSEHHTTNWDVAVLLYWAAKNGFMLRFMIKKEVEGWFLIGDLLKKAGAIYIDRDAPLSAMKTILKAARGEENFRLLIAPKGTRAKTEGWKPGFYYLAQKLNVPLLPGGPDYKRKVAMTAPMITPSGDIHADIEQMRPFFEQLTPKHPQFAAPVRLLPEEATPEQSAAL